MTVLDLCSINSGDSTSMCLLPMEGGGGGLETTLSLHSGMLQWQKIERTQLGGTQGIFCDVIAFQIDEGPLTASSSVLHSAAC